MPKVLNSEKNIGGYGECLTVTTHRICYNLEKIGRHDFTSIMLDELCSCELKYRSKPSLFFLAVFSFLGAIYEYTLLYSATAKFLGGRVAWDRISGTAFELLLFGYSDGGLGAKNMPDDVQSYIYMTRGAIFAGIIFLIAYAMSRRLLLSFASAGATIQLAISSENKTSALAFIDDVEHAKAGYR